MFYLLPLPQKCRLPYQRHINTYINPIKGRLLKSCLKMPSMIQIKTLKPLKLGHNLFIYMTNTRTNVVFPMRGNGLKSRLKMSGMVQKKKKLYQDTTNLKHNLFIYMVNTGIKIHCNKCMQVQFSFYNIINNKLLIKC